MTSWLDRVDGVGVDERPDLRRRRPGPGRRSARPSARPAWRRTPRRRRRAPGSGWRRCRPRPCCASWRASRRRRRRRRRRPRRRGTARCRRAPCRRAGGSRADCLTSCLPTPVEPVKLTLRRRSSAISATDDRAGAVVGMTLRTPAGQADLGEQLGELEHRQRRLGRGLDDHRAAGRDGRADLAGAHRDREVPRRDEQARARPVAWRVSSRLLPSGADIQRPWIRTASSENQRKNSAP